MKSNKHYLYRHIRLDKNEPFYIGIGTTDSNFINSSNPKLVYNRAFVIKRRNSIWNKIVSKTDYRVEIIMESDDYEFIKEKEVEFVKLYGRKDLNTGILANLTDGGDSAKNTSRVKTGKDNPKSKTRFIYNLDGIIIGKFCSFTEACKKLNINKDNNNQSYSPSKSRYSETFYGNRIMFIKGFLVSDIYLGMKIFPYKKFSYDTHKKAIIQYSKSGDYIKEWNSAKEAAMALGGINKSPSITNCANGLRLSASGYIWKYK